MNNLRKIVIAPFVAIIWLYQNLISSWTPTTCRYQPTCSHYTKEALKRHGLLRGGGYAIKRILSCNPWGGQGFDPVPPARDTSKNS